MKQFSRTSVYIIVSLLFHFTVLLFLPDLNFEIKLPEKKILDIELIKVPIKSVKSEPLQSAKNEKLQLKGEDNKKSRSVSAPIFKPDMQLPIATVIDKIPLTEQQKLSEGTSITIDGKTNPNLGKEIKNIESGLKKDSSDISGKGKTTNLGKNDFFEIKSDGNIERRLIYIPPKPTFFLESNTRVKLKFQIDSKGIPYSIVLLTKSAPNIEKIAVKFVSDLRFESVNYSTPDSAAITLYFNVR